MAPLRVDGTWYSLLSLCDSLLSKNTIEIESEKCYKLRIKSYHHINAFLFIEPPRSIDVDSFFFVFYYEDYSVAGWPSSSLLLFPPPIPCRGIDLVPQLHTLRVYSRRILTCHGITTVGRWSRGPLATHVCIHQRSSTKKALGDRQNNHNNRQTANVLNVPLLLLLFCVLSSIITYVIILLLLFAK